MEIDPPILNVSGILSYMDVFHRLEALGAAFGGYITKSIGVDIRAGNKNPVYVDYGSYGLNSFALPNPGIEQWLDDFETYPISKPLVASVFGFRPDEYFTVVESSESSVTAFELNLSCPNKIATTNETSVMRTMGSDPQVVEGILKGVKDITSKPVIAKLSPNVDPVTIALAAEKGGADYISCGNTLGPGLAIDIYAKRPILAGITGGLSGSAIKPIVMKQIYDLYETVDLPIIAYGGIFTWKDAVEYMMAGASMVGLGTCLAHKTTDEIVRFTNDLWENILQFTTEHGDVVGVAHV